MIKHKLNKCKQADEVATDAEEVINADVTNEVVTDTEAEKVDVTSIIIPKTENVSNTEAIEIDAEAEVNEETKITDNVIFAKKNAEY